MNPLDTYYESHEEQVRSCLLALRSTILRQDAEISESWKYGMPFFCFRGKMFCYLWIHKTYHQPYIGMVDGMYFDEPFLIQEGRKRMKIMLLDPTKDLPAKRIEGILKKALSLRKRSSGKRVE